MPQVIRKIYGSFLREKNIRLDIHRQIVRNHSRQVQFYNFWDEPFNEMYWSRWFSARPFLFENNPLLKIGLFSVFGEREIINHTDCDINIFYSAENVKNNHFLRYSDYFLSSSKIDLAMGFEYFEDDRYCRFPNWIDVFFLQQDQICDICNKLRFPDISQKTLFSSLICSHDNNGLRSSIVNAIAPLGHVCCPGKYMHNDDSLLQEYNDSKAEYLSRFLFNICPENSNAMGYVTEKIFQSISSGCIPIYWGSNNQPEPDVLNWDAVVFWKKDGDNTDSLNLIQDLMGNQKLMKEFISQPRLLSTAEEYIADTLNDVERRVLRLISKQ